jgi:hypothetical protein
MMIVTRFLERQGRLFWGIVGIALILILGVIDFLTEKGLLDSDNLVTHAVPRPRAPTCVLEFGNWTFQDSITHDRKCSLW